jgi:hypothetical protein
MGGAVIGVLVVPGWCSPTHRAFRGDPESRDINRHRTELTVGD